LGRFTPRHRISGWQFGGSIFHALGFQRPVTTEERGRGEGEKEGGEGKTPASEASRWLRSEPDIAQRNLAPKTRRGKMKFRGQIYQKCANCQTLPVVTSQSIFYSSGKEAEGGKEA